MVSDGRGRQADRALESPLTPADVGLATILRLEVLEASKR
jgi:hypothetical protein